MTFHFCYGKDFLQLTDTNFEVWINAPSFLRWWQVTTTSPSLKLQTFGSLCAKREAIQVLLNWIQGKQNHGLSLHWTPYRASYKPGGSHLSYHRTSSCYTELRKPYNQPQGWTIFDARKIMNCLGLGRVGWDKENFCKQVYNNIYTLELSRIVRYCWFESLIFQKYK